MSCSLTMSADNSSLEAMMALGQWANIGTPIEVYLHSSEMAVEEINIEFTIGDDVQTATLPVSIEAGTITKIELPFAVNGPAHTYQPYTLHINSAAGDVELQGTVGIVDNSWHRNLLVEEGTGTWCGNCPRGIVAMRLLKEKYPDTFVGMTLHYANSAHSEVMDYHDYGRFMIDNGYITMFPSSTINRRYHDIDPFNDILEGGIYDEMLREATPASFSLKGEYINDYMAVRLTATTAFDIIDPTHEYRIAFACIENDIHQPGDDRYKQFNNYGNNAYGEFYGYEKYPSWIPSEEMWYQEVVRFITDMNGTPGSLPATLSLNEEYEYTVDMDIPANVLNGENACYIGMLIDATTQEILNCAEISADEVDRGSEVPLFYDGFRYGLIGKNYVRYDLDGNKPFSSINLEVGDAWGIGEEDGNYYAFSTSYYSTSGTSDDWLITPEIDVEDVSSVSLTWRARSSNTKYKDGYEVLLSITGSEVADFSLLETFTKEEAVWTVHQLTIDTQDVQHLRIAFRNTTKNGEKLYVDDIRMERNETTPTYLNAVNPSTNSLHSIRYDLSGRCLTDASYKRGIVIERNADGHYIKRINQ